MRLTYTCNGAGGRGQVASICRDLHFDNETNVIAASFWVPSSRTRYT